VNFARRTECNKCGAPSPAGGGGGGGSNRGGGDYNSGRSGNYGGRNYDGNRGGRSSNYGGRGGRDDRDDGGYAQVPPPAPVPSYGAPPVGNYPPAPNAYGGRNDYGGEAVPPPASYGGPSSYPPSYGAPSAPSSYNAPAGRGGPPGGYDGGYAGRSMGGVARDGGGYGGGPVEPPAVKVKQCDENCGDSCDNARIYISNLPPDVTTDELQELFGGIGQVLISVLLIISSIVDTGLQYMLNLTNLVSSCSMVIICDLRQTIDFVVLCRT